MLSKLYTDELTELERAWQVAFRIGLTLSLFFVHPAEIRFFSCFTCRILDARFIYFATPALKSTKFTNYSYNMGNMRMTGMENAELSF